MSQEEVINVLKESKEPLSLSEICKKLNERPQKISMQLAKLVKHGEVEEIVLHRALSLKFYNSRKPLRLFRCLL